MIMATTVQTRQRLSPHFVIEEFDSHDGEKVPAASIPALKELCVHMLEPLRAKYGPCTVNSGHRSVAHNADVGGVANSQHIYHKHPGSVAADVKFSSGTVADWARSARWRFSNKPRWTANHRGGVGDYPTQHFIHVDSATRRNWHG
jgi:uncharacterized protein YcbK (DUF882 family)